MTTTTTPAAQSQSSSVKEIVEALLPSLIAAAQPRQYAPPAPKPKIVCRECGMLESICEGKHTRMVVYPLRRPEYADCFQGVSINFVKYMSTSPDHQLVVPESLVGTIQSHIDAYEDNEVAVRNGRKKTKAHGGKAQPAVDGWR
jgi:hypothetical protein